MTDAPPIAARIAELVAVSKGLSIELEATRRQVAFIGEIAQDLLKTATALKADIEQLKQLHH